MSCQITIKHKNIFRKNRPVYSVYSVDPVGLVDPVDTVDPVYTGDPVTR